MTEKPKIAFLVPAYDNIKLPAWQSHINLISMAGVFCQPFILTASSCYVHDSRNRLLELFREADEKINFDFVFWIDSDIVFNWQDCEKLLKSLQDEKASIMAGLYFNALPNGLVPMFSSYVSEEDKYVPLDLSVDAPKVRVIDAGGLGFVVQTAQSLRKMMGDHGKSFFGFRISKRGKLIGEDNLFFEFARKSGFVVCGDERVRIWHCKTLTI